MKGFIKKMSTKELDAWINKLPYNWMKAIRYQQIREVHQTYLPKHERSKIK